MRETVNKWNQIAAGLRELEETVVEVGWFDEDAATVAYINDRGGNRGDNPPPRPVLAPGMDAAAERVRQIQASAAAKIMRGANGRSTARDAAEAIGATVEQAVRDAIDAVAPPNAPETVAQKHGYTAPLRGFSPDRIWNRLEYRVLSPSEAASD